jgi:hypothetical protein
LSGVGSTEPPESGGGGSAGAGAGNADDSLERLGRLLDRAVRALGEAGEADAACRIAAEAWWLLKEPAPRAARRLNATLHYLTVQPRKTDREENR